MPIDRVIAAASAETFRLHGQASTASDPRCSATMQRPHWESLGSEVTSLRRDLITGSLDSPESFSTGATEPMEQVIRNPTSRKRVRWTIARRQCWS